MKNIQRPLVIDSSVALKWLNKQDESNLEQADAILKHVQEGKFYLVMPELSKYEVGNALLSKKAPIKATLASLATYYHIPIEFVASNEQQAESTMRIAHESNMTYYDAAFIALAIDREADLITDNLKHQGKYKGKDVKIIALVNWK